jgi:uncharacterized protein YbaP (TraB family)
MFKSFLRRTLAAFGLLGLATGAAAAPAKPALWAVSDADTTVYLFGTIHLLPQNYQWRSPKLDEAMQSSQQLVVETIIDEKKPLEMMNALSSLAFSPGQPPIAERVPPAKRAALDAAIKQSGLPRAAFDRMETWAAAFMLLGNQFKAMGLKAGAGVETVLRTSFASQGKGVGQLETNREQLSYFDGLPEAAQRGLLEGAIEEPKSMTKDFDRMLSAWTRGDVEAIAATFNRDLSSSPAMRDALLDRRNANWKRWVEQRMTKPGSVMVAVGAGHLAGRNSLVDMLQREGLKVRRLQ